MAITDKQTKWQIGPLVFDAGTNVLSGPKGEELLEPKASALLHYLVLNPNRDISRDELIEHVWLGQIVSDGAINRVIVRLRRALGDDEKPRRIIVTVPKVGYRFVGEASGGPAQNSTIDNNRTAPIFSIQRIMAIVVVLAAGIFLLRESSQQTEQGPAILLPIARLSSPQFDGTGAPDGNQFVYSQRIGRGAELYWLSEPNANPQRIGATGGEAIGARWSPAGDRLAYVFKQDGRCELHLLDMTEPRATKPRVLYECMPSRAIPLAFSAGGDQLVFSERASSYAPHTLFTINLNTGSKSRLSQPTAVGRGNHWLDVHPDTGLVLMLADQKPGQTSAYSLNIQEGTFTRLIDWPYKVDTAIWSHDGQSIVHQGRHPSYELVRTDPATGETRVLVADSRRMIHPQRMADGRNYSFTSYIFDRDVTLDGQRLAMLNSSVMDYLPTLSRNGTSLAFISKRSGESRIYEHAISGGQLSSVELPEKGRALVGMDWSFDDRYLLLTTSNELWVLDVDTGTVTTTHAPDLPTYAANWSGERSFTYSVFHKGRWHVREVQISTGEMRTLDPRWAFAVTSPDAQILIDQQFALFERGTRRLDLPCAAPLSLFSMTIRLDGRDLYCRAQDKPTDLLVLHDLQETERMEGAVDETSRHFSVGNGRLAYAKLKGLASDIMQTHFPQ